MTINNVVRGYPSQSGRPIKRQAIDLNRGQAVQRIFPYVVSFGTYNDIKNLEKVSKSFCYIIPDNLKSVFRLEEQMRGLSGRLKLNNMSVVFKYFWNSYSNNIFDYYEVIGNHPTRYNSLRYFLVEKYLHFTIRSTQITKDITTAECSLFLTAFRKEGNVTEDLKEAVASSLERSQRINEQIVKEQNDKALVTLRYLFTGIKSHKFIVNALKKLFSNGLLTPAADAFLSNIIHDLLIGDEYRLGALVMSEFARSEQEDDPQWLYDILLPLLNFEDLDTTHTLNTIRRICTCFTDQWYPIHACLEFAREYLKNENAEGCLEVLKIAEELISITDDAAVNVWIWRINNLKQQASNI